MRGTTPTIRIAGWWHARTPRERHLLLAMGVAVAAFALWFGILSPLQHARERAADRHAAAVQTRLEVERGLAAITASNASHPQAPEAGDVIATITRSASAAGVGIDRQDPTPDGGVHVEIHSVRAEVLFAWLDALRLDHGIAPLEIEVEPREGRLSARLGFGQQ